MANTAGNIELPHESESLLSLGISGSDVSSWNDVFVFASRALLSRVTQLYFYLLK
jgi:hypothetical protein